MDQMALLWTLASTFFAWLALFMQKIVAEEGRSAALFSMLSYAVSAVLAVIILFSLREVPPAWRMIAVFGIAAGISQGLSNYVRIESLKYIDSVLGISI